MLPMGHRARRALPEALPLLNIAVRHDVAPAVPVRDHAIHRAPTRIRGGLPVA